MFVQYFANTRNVPTGRGGVGAVMKYLCHAAHPVDGGWHGLIHVGLGGPGAILTFRALLKRWVGKGTGDSFLALGLVSMGG